MIVESRLKFHVGVILLIAIGIGLIVYKHISLGIPLWPNTKQSVWNIEAAIKFNATGGPAEVSLALPDQPQGYRILDEGFASSGYGFSKADRNGRTRALWTVRDANGWQTLYYQLSVAKHNTSEAQSASHNPVTSPKRLDEPHNTAALSLLKESQSRSTDNVTLAKELIKQLVMPQPSQEAQLLLGNNPSIRQRTETLIHLLTMASVPARMARGLILEDGRRRQPVRYYLDVYDGRQWRLFDPKQAEAVLGDDVLIWQRGGPSMLEVSGGFNSRVEFSILESRRTSQGVALQHGRRQGEALIDFSIYSLPVAEQNAFKYILLVPIGALVVVFFRLFVGLKTSGTFMPILIALAFIKTSLVTGVIIFVTVVGVGLWIRSFLSRLNLLLVARISAVIIVVVILMAGISIASYKLGMSQALTITFFPMVILAWTIERMSILWEEEGPREVLIQGFGSLLVAVIAFQLMTNPVIEYLTFNFPELLLVNLGLILLAGQYSGYRLSELKRFRAMVHSPLEK